MMNYDDRDSSSCCSSIANLAELDGSHAKTNDDIDIDIDIDISTTMDPSLQKKLAFDKQTKQTSSDSCTKTDENFSKLALKLPLPDEKELASTAAAAAAAGAKVARGSGTNTNTKMNTELSKKLSASETSTTDHQNERNDSSSNNDNTQRSAQSDTESKEQRQERFLRTTPGAFAINNPLSASSEVPRLEQRQSFLLGGTFTATVLTASTSQPLSSAPDEESTYDRTSDSNSNYLQVVDPPQSEQEQEAEQESQQQEPVTATVQLASTQYLSAVRIGHESEIYDGEILNDPTDQERMEKERKQKARRFYILLLFVITICLWIPWSTAKKERSRLGGLGESAGQATQVPTQAPTFDRGELKTYLISILATISGPDGERVFYRGNRATSIIRINALNWMLDDLLAVESSNPYLIPEWKHLQRYVLALLYYSTNGAAWDIKANFLSKLDECQWIGATPFEWQKRDPVMQSINENIGVTCNEDGKIQGVHLQWNDLSGTIPEELNYFKDSLEVLSLSGGLISGRIPSSFSKLTKLKTLALNDNCLSGAIPEGISTELPLLERFSVINNGELYGSLNGFCNKKEYASERILAVASECPIPPNIGDNNTEQGSSDIYDGLECDCCICCDRNNYDCYDSQSGDFWKSYNLNAKETVYNHLKSFDRDSECRTLANRKWVKDNCPCRIRSSPNITEDGLYAFECSECSGEDDEKTFMDWFWLPSEPALGGEGGV